jgi:hypothetical protein
MTQARQWLLTSVLSLEFVDEIGRPIREFGQRFWSRRRVWDHGCDVAGMRVWPLRVRECCGEYFRARNPVIFPRQCHSRAGLIDLAAIRRRPKSRKVEPVLASLDRFDLKIPGFLARGNDRESHHACESHKKTYLRDAASLSPSSRLLSVLTRQPNRKNSIAFPAHILRFSSSGTSA